MGGKSFNVTENFLRRKWTWMAIMNAVCSTRIFIFHRSLKTRRLDEKLRRASQMYRTWTYVRRNTKQPAFHRRSRFCVVSFSQKSNSRQKSSVVPGRQTHKLLCFTSLNRRYVLRECLTDDDDGNDDDDLKYLRRTLPPPRTRNKFSLRHGRRGQRSRHVNSDCKYDFVCLRQTLRQKRNRTFFNF